MKLPVPLFFDWDEGNLEKNWKTHEVHFQECEQVFSNEPIKVFQDKSHSKIEERFLAYGQTNSKRKLAVVFTVRQEKIRVISARDQNKKERRLYEENKENS